MTWIPLAQRFSRLPFILAGPILRRIEPRAVTVWLALKESQTVTLRIYSRDESGHLIQRLEGTRRTVRLGDHLETPGILAMNPQMADPLERLVYPGHPLPGFVLPSEDLNQVRILHGSC